MKEVTLKVPDHKIDFVLELIEQLGLQFTEDIEIPEDHKKIVRERIRNSDQKKLIPWREARKRLEFKSKK